MPRSKFNPRNDSSVVLCPCSVCKSEKYVSGKVYKQHIQRYHKHISNVQTCTRAVVEPREKETSDEQVREGTFCVSYSDSYELLGTSSNSPSNLPDNSSLQPLAAPIYTNSDTDSTIASTSDSESQSFVENIEIGELGVNTFESEGTDESSIAAVVTGTKSYEDFLYESDRAKVALYDGCQFTVLQTLAAFFLWFSSHPFVSKKALSDMLELQHNILPSGNSMPCNYRQAEKFIEPFLLPIVTYHVCPNDCVLFRKSPREDNSKLDACPKCGAARYRARGTVRTKQAVRRFLYYPLGPRWRRMFGDATLSQVLQSHGGPREKEQVNLNDVQNAPVFKRCFHKSSGYFRGDPRGLALQLSTDGVNPFEEKTAKYSMWPIVLSMLNLPRHTRHLFSNLMMVGIMPSNGKREPKNVHPYLEVVVDELIELSGSKMFDAYKQASFGFKVKLLNYVLDYPGLNKIFCASGSGALQGCMWCDFRGTYYKTLDKTVYIGNRRFLPTNSELRKDCTNFPDLKEEHRPAPKTYDQDELTAKHKAYESANSKAKKADIAKATGCHGRYSFMLLPDHSRPEQAFPDPMHTLKNCVKNVHDLITGKTDSLKVRKSEAELGRSEEAICEGQLAAEPPKKRRKSQGKRSASLPPAKYTLSKRDIKVADERALSVRVPAEFGWSPQPFFSHTSQMKSHDWKQVATKGIMKFCLRGLLGKEQCQTLFKFLDALADLCSEEQNPSKIQLLEDRINLVCALMERDFPVSLQTISYHILHHIPEGITSFGPVHGWWMFAYERFNSWICQRVTNRRHPEATVMRTYQYLLQKSVQTTRHSAAKASTRATNTYGSY